MKFFNINRLSLARPFPDIKTLMFQKMSYNKLLEDKLFFNQGREALIFGLDALNIKPGVSILVPAYMCESTVTPLRLAGYKVIFFDIEENLKFNSVKLIVLAIKHQAKAILVVHYFGFPCNIQEISQLCESLEIKLIEDCSHSFLSKIEIDDEVTSGDIVIYSLRKSFPIRDGGALKINDSTNPKVANLFRLKPKFYFSDYFYLFSRLIEYIISFICWPNLYSNWIDNLKNLIRRKASNDNKVANFTIRKSKSPSVQLVKYVSSTRYINKTKARIIYNYNKIISSASDLGFIPQYDVLPPSCIPQWVILKDTSGGLVDKLRAKGIGACHWPGNELVPEAAATISKYPNSKRLNFELALIPTHQSIGDRECNLIISSLEFLAENIVLEE